MSDEAEAWSCVLVTASWCVLAGSGGMSLAVWELRMEGGDLKGQHYPHTLVPWGLQGPQSPEQRRLIEQQGCWLGGRMEWTSGSAEGQEPGPRTG